MQACSWELYGSLCGLVDWDGEGTAGNVVRSPADHHRVVALLLGLENHVVVGASRVLAVELIDRVSSR